MVKPKKSTKGKKRVKRPPMTTKVELMEYLRDNEEEYPFNEQLWAKSVEKANIDKKKELPVATITIKDEYGNETTTVKSDLGSTGVMLVTNPVSQYWKLLNLPQYQKQGQKLLAEQSYSTNETTQEVMDLITNEDDGGEYNEIIAWINSNKNSQERIFLKSKYASYYDNYEINDGADKTLLTVILGYELDIFRFNVIRASGKQVEGRDIKEIVKSLREVLEAMKWTKKQRTAKDDMAQNRFTILMEKHCKNGAFEPEHHEYDNDEIDWLLENIPKWMEKMDWHE